jgi:hypothetical protein
VAAASALVELVGFFGDSLPHRLVTQAKFANDFDRDFSAAAVTALILGH